MLYRIWKNFTCYLSMVKFSHSIFALPLAGIAFVQSFPKSHLIGDVYGTFFLLSKIIVCMVFLRSSAMGFNRLIDRKYDAANPRTVDREIPKGTISTGQVQFFILLCSFIFILSAISINYLTAILSIPALILAFGYSYTKRFTNLSHFFLGMVIGIVPIATWIAVTGGTDLIGIYWSFGLLFYISGFDLLYSCQDYEFDKKNKLHSIPASLGISSALGIARVCHGVALFFFLLAGIQERVSPIFFITIVIVALLFLWEHLLVRPNFLHRIPIAFFHVNASISTVLFLGVILDKYMLALWPF